MKTILISLAFVLSVHVVVADNIYLKDGSVFRNVQVIDTVGVNLRYLRTTSTAYELVSLSSILRIEFVPIDPRKPSVLEDLQDQLLRITTITGDVFDGYFRSSDSLSVTYTTVDGLRTINRSRLLSVTKLDSKTNRPLSGSAEQRNFVVVNEYPHLILAVPAIAGGIWGFSLLKDASDLRDGIEAAKQLGLGNYTADAEREASEKEIGGILVSACSVALLIYAVIPEQVRVAQDVSIAPTSKGVLLSIRF